MRISEVYPSTQGEGPNVGKTTVFTRFGGCNLRCAGWPCDTPHAIFPEEYRHTWKQMSPDQVVDRVHLMALSVGATNVTLTGGEPFIQQDDELKELCERLTDLRYTIDCFSNGTVPYPDWVADHINFIMDWKLPGSEEDPYDSNRFDNLDLLIDSALDQSVKFVIKDGNDYFKAKELWKSFLRDFSMIQVFYGRVWEGELQDKDLVALVMEDKLPWRLNVQLHNHIWPVNERRR